jgi:uncharacterized protein YhhL (DUF1145 family)
MSRPVSIAGKIISIIFWLLVIWSITDAGIGMIVTTIRVLGAVTLAIHAVEVVMFLTQDKYQNIPKPLNTLQILLFGVFHLGTLKKINSVK